jgi:hypothetical protein
VTLPKEQRPPVEKQAVAFVDPLEDCLTLALMRTKKQFEIEVGQVAATTVEIISKRLTAFDFSFLLRGQLGTAPFSRFVLRFAVQGVGPPSQGCCSKLDMLIPPHNVSDLETIGDGSPLQNIPPCRCDQLH